MAMYFDFFTTEKNHDFVSIVTTEGSDEETYTLTGGSCSQGFPETTNLQSTTSRVVVKFTSDFNYEYKGFALRCGKS